jgi:uncharacterized protein involved in outer membrane biogenesis
MRRIIRYLLLGLVVGIVFLVAAVAIFAAMFDANAYKQDLSELVREHTGRELRFQGDIGLTIYPELGMKLGAMRFANAAGFGELPMIRVGEASISVNVASLFRLSPEIDKLVLRDLEINLIRNKAGVNNWDDLLQAQAQQAEKTAPESAAGTANGGKSETTSPGGDGGFELKGAFGGLDLQNIKLLWLDEQAGTKYEVSDLDISTGRIVPNQPFPMTLHVDASADDVLVSLDFSSDVEYLIAEQRLTLSDMLLALNQFEIGGKLQLSDFSRPTPVLRFDLASKNLDVDALMGTPPAEPAGPPRSGQDSGTSKPDEDVQIKLPMQTLRDLDIDGKISIARIKAQNLHMSDLAIAVKARDGMVGLKPLTLNLYEGRVESSAVIDVRSEIPKYGLSESIVGVQAGPLLKDFTGEQTISGKLDAEANLTTGGEWLSELKRNSNGALKLAFSDGALHGFNIRQSIDSAKARLHGEEPPPKKTLKTDFSSLSLSGLIRNGVFSSNDLDLQAPLLRARGKGSADLNEETVDYLLEAKLVGTVAGQQGGSADELAGLAIPVKIEGPFSGPEIDVQLDEMLKARADAEKAKLKADIAAQKKALEEQLEAEKKALEESKKRELEKKREVEEAKAKKKLEEKLKNLFD